jgi:23S rRNA pseudouridine1911/1915/1917 synthase
MPECEWGWRITDEELSHWITSDGPNVLVVNKPGLVVCHPSKHGPWSSLVGALRESGRLTRVHMVYRLDRETSGVMVFAKNSETARRLQCAVEGRRVRKSYLAVVEGRWSEPRVVERAMGRDLFSGISSRQRVFDGPEAQEAVTEFVPLAWGDGVTVLRAHPRTGRMHQIRVHAAWAGHPVVGDKLYGPDPSLFLEFIEKGFTARLAERLPMRRQALHALKMEFGEGGVEGEFSAPPPSDIQAFCQSRGIDLSGLVLDS